MLAVLFTVILVSPPGLALPANTVKATAIPNSKDAASSSRTSAGREMDVGLWVIAMAPSKIWLA